MGKDFSYTTGHVIPTAHGRFDLSMAIGTFSNGHFGAVFFADVVMHQVFFAFGALHSDHTHSTGFAYIFCH